MLTNKDEKAFGAFEKNILRKMYFPVRIEDDALAKTYISKTKQYKITIDSPLKNLLHFKMPKNWVEYDNAIERIFFEYT